MIQSVLKYEVSVMIENHRLARGIAFLSQEVALPESRREPRSSPTPRVIRGTANQKGRSFYRLVVVCPFESIRDYSAATSSVLCAQRYAVSETFHSTQQEPSEESLIMQNVWNGRTASNRYEEMFFPAGAWRVAQGLPALAPASEHTWQRSGPDTLQPLLPDQGPHIFFNAQPERRLPIDVRSLWLVGALVLSYGFVSCANSCEETSIEMLIVVAVFFIARGVIEKLKSKSSPVRQQQKVGERPRERPKKPDCESAVDALCTESTKLQSVIACEKAWLELNGEHAGTRTCLEVNQARLERIREEQESRLNT